MKRRQGCEFPLRRHSAGSSRPSALRLLWGSLPKAVYPPRGPRGRPGPGPGLGCEEAAARARGSDPPGAPPQRPPCPAALLRASRGRELPPPPRREPLSCPAASGPGLGHGDQGREGRVSGAGRAAAAGGLGARVGGAGRRAGRSASQPCRRLPAGTRCSSWAARSCGSSGPTSSCWRCGPACRSPRTPSSSASPWSECGGGEGAGPGPAQPPAAGAVAGLGLPCRGKGPAPTGGCGGAPAASRAPAPPQRHTSRHTASCRLLLGCGLPG